MQFNISENDSTQIAENAFTELIPENSDGFCGDGGVFGIVNIKQLRMKNIFAT